MDGAHYLSSIQNPMVVSAAPSAKYARFSVTFSGTSLRCDTPKPGLNLPRAPLIKEMTANAISTTAIMRASVTFFSLFSQVLWLGNVSELQLNTTLKKAHSPRRNSNAPLT